MPLNFAECIELKMLTKFEHIVQSLLNTCLIKMSDRIRPTDLSRDVSDYDVDLAL